MIRGHVTVGPVLCTKAAMNPALQAHFFVAGSYRVRRDPRRDFDGDHEFGHLRMVTMLLRKFRYPGPWLLDSGALAVQPTALQEEMAGTGTDSWLANNQARLAKLRESQDII